MPRIVKNENQGEGVYYLEVKLDEQDPVPEPGQFYMIQVSKIAPILPRPFIAYTYDRDEHIVSFLIQKRGEGTEMLSKKRAGEKIRVFGPLGIPFNWEGKKKLCLIGGGIGLAALNMIAERVNSEYPDAEISAYLGFTGEPYGLDSFTKNVNGRIYIKSHGGYITDNVEIKEGETVIACGPWPMMEKICRITPAENDVYLSLEARMACGVGACLGCVREVPLNYKKEEGSENLIPAGNRRIQVCTEGPYFKREVTQ